MSARRERNPFEVLGLPVTAPPREVERQAQKLLAMIGVGLAEDSSEDAEHEIRWALSELRDPRRRLIHEALARNLTADRLSAQDLEASLDDIERALPSTTPTSAMLAEEILWRHLERPPPYELPPDHEERRRRVFESARGPEPVPTLLAEMDWGELVAWRPPVRHPRKTKKKDARHG